MPRIGQAFGGTVSGAAAGFAAAGPPGALAGGAIGLFAGLLSESPSEIREKRMEAYRRRLKDLRLQETKSVLENIAQGTKAQQNRASAGASRRALAQGRLGDVEEIAAPITMDIANKSVALRSDAMADIDQRYNQLEAEAAASEYSAPIDPSPADYITSIAPAVAQIGLSAKQDERIAGIVGQRQEELDYYRGIRENMFGNRGNVIDDPTGNTGYYPGNEIPTIGNLATVETLPEYFQNYRVPRLSLYGIGRRKE